VAAYVLQRAYVPLDVHPDRGERVEVLVDAPAQEYPEVGLRVLPGLAALIAKSARRLSLLFQLVGGGRVTVLL
jgi:hypothetical protein